MKLAAGLIGALLVAVVPVTEVVWTASEAPERASAPVALHAPPALTAAELTAVVQRYCQVCHNDQLLTGNMSLQGFDVANPMAKPEIAEKMIQKLRVGMMPPPGAPRPGQDTLAELVTTLEQTMDRAAAANPNPGSRQFQRLNRADYTASIRDLLGLEIDAGAYLPLDTKSANFDNIADVQLLSATLMDAYMRAATMVSRLAVGYEDAGPAEVQYMVSRWATQWDHQPGTPIGTRGGTSVIHNFPADGEYVFKVQFHNETTGIIVGDGHNALHTADEPEQLEISIDGERIAVIEVDRWMNVEDITDGPNGVSRKTGPIFVRAGAHRVSAAFLDRWEGIHPDLITPHDWSIVSTAIAGEYGNIFVPHLRDLVVSGPHKVTGISDTPTRRRIFTCRPLTDAEVQPCARQIVSSLATKAFRRPVREDELQALMGFYDTAASDQGFEGGIRVALQAILASPHFIFRVEEPVAGARAGTNSRVGDFDLASRLSYFLWATPPDDELLAVAREGKLGDLRVLEAQARRMLADPRAQSLGTRFASQWLRLQDLEGLNPDVRNYPDFHIQLRDALRQETEHFFNHLVKEDRPFEELFTANYTFLNERLAKHYGINGVAGEEFRRVPYPDDKRQGLFGHGSVLASTSVAARTSPVLRGKWVMEVILGTPPPPPPPGVPALEETNNVVAGGRVMTTRERMEAHRKAPVCNSCHRFMDPIGLSLDNYDVTGKWRIRENGNALDTRGELYDGTPVQSPRDLNQAMLKRQVPIMRNFTKNMMTYAIGRRVEHYDMPAIRKIVGDAEANGYKMTSFILGVVKSDAFRMQRAEVTTDSSL
jgi:cytochrome c5